MDQTIEAGYQIHITSCNYDESDIQTLVLSELEEEDVKFYVALLKCFKEYSNINRSDERLVGICRKVLEDYPNISFREGCYWSYIESTGTSEANYYYDIICDTLLGYSDNNLDTLRVYKTHTVLYIPQVCEDVTSKF